LLLIIVFYSFINFSYADIRQYQPFKKATITLWHHKDMVAMDVICFISGRIKIEVLAGYTSVYKTARNADMLQIIAGMIKLRPMQFNPKPYAYRSDSNSGNEISLHSKLIMNILLKWHIFYILFCLAFI